MYLQEKIYGKLRIAWISTKFKILVFIAYIILTLLLTYPLAFL